MNAISKWMVAAACGLALTACGGGGGDSDITITASAGVGGTISPETVKVKPGATQTFTITPNSGYLIASVDGTCGGTLNGTTYTTSPINAACTVAASFSRTFTYEWNAAGANVNADVVLAAFNQEGAKGYRYLYDMGGGTCTPGSWCAAQLLVGSLFVNDGLAPSYTYELLPNPGNTADFIAQANTQGAKGYQYVAWHATSFSGPLSNTRISHVLYRKDGGSTATYTYATEAAGSMAVDAFVAQANARGQSGYYFYGRIGNGDPEPANLYVKNNASKATYTYEVFSSPFPSFGPPYYQQMNIEGAKGYFPMYIDIPNVPSTVYIKDQTQSATFTFQLPDDVVATANPAAVSQLNSYGAQGYSPWNNGLDVYRYFFRATNCSGGWLCGVPNLPYSGQ